MSPIGRYVVLVFLILVSAVRDANARLAVDHHVLRLADRFPLHPFPHPPRIRSCHFNLEYQKQVYLNSSRICSRRVLHAPKFQFKQALECSESQRYDGDAGQEQRP